MTISEMKDWFNILQDKYGSPYYTDSEISLFLQRAHIEFVKSLLPTTPSDGPNIELSQDTVSQIAPLIYDLGVLNMNTSGEVTKASIQSSLNSEISGGILWRPLAIGWTLTGDERPVKYMRSNDKWEFAINYFKKPSVTNPKVRETAEAYIFSPITTQAKIYFTVLKYPVKVNIGTSVSSDLPDFTHDKIVAIALELTGVASRDVALAQLLQLKNNK